MAGEVSLHREPHRVRRKALLDAWTQADRLMRWAGFGAVAAAAVPSRGRTLVLEAGLGGVARSLGEGAQLVEPNESLASGARRRWRIPVVQADPLRLLASARVASAENTAMNVRRSRLPAHNGRWSAIVLGAVLHRYSGQELPAFLALCAAATDSIVVVQWRPSLMAGAFQLIAGVLVSAECAHELRLARRHAPSAEELDCAATKAGLRVEQTASSTLVEAYLLRKVR